MNGRHGEQPAEHEREAPTSMTAPVLVLALGSTVVGFLAIPGVWEPFEDWLEPVVAPLVTPSSGEEWLTSLIAVTLGTIGGYLAYRAFRAGRELVADGALRTALEHKLWFDELYDAVFSRPAQALAVRLRDDVEQPVVQGGLDEIADGTLDASAVVGRAQSGLLRTYALAFAVSVAPGVRLDFGTCAAHSAGRMLVNAR